MATARTFLAESVTLRPYLERNSRTALVGRAFHATWPSFCMHQRMHAESAGRTLLVSMKSMMLVDVRFCPIVEPRNCA